MGDSEVARRERRKALWKSMRDALLSPAAFTMLAIIGLSPLIISLIAYVLFRSLLFAPSGLWVWTGLVLGVIGTLAGFSWLYRGGIRAKEHPGDRKLVRQAMWGVPIFFGSVLLFLPAAVVYAMRQDMPDPEDIRTPKGRIVHVGPEKDIRMMIDIAEKQGIFVWLAHY